MINWTNPKSLQELQQTLSTYDMEIDLPNDALAVLSQNADGTYFFEWICTYAQEERSYPSQMVSSCEELLLLILQILFSRITPK